MKMATPTSSSKISYYGGSLLGKNRIFSNKSHENFHIPSSWKRLEPLLTTSGKEQFILLPKSHMVTVLAYETGNQVACLVPQMEDSEGKNIIIESATLATYGTTTMSNIEEVLMMDEDRKSLSSLSNEVLLVGCNDGTLREFDLSNNFIQGTKNGKNRNSGKYYIHGPCCGPRRVYTLKKGCAIRKITTVDKGRGGGILGFCLIEEKENSREIIQTMCRFVLKPQERKGAHKFDLSEEILNLHQFVFRMGHDRRGKILSNIPFHMFSLRPTKTSSIVQTKKDLLVVVVTSSNFQVYQEETDEDGNQTGKHPILTLPVDECISAARLSPNGVDIVFGNWIGQIITLKNAINAILEHNATEKKRIIPLGSFLEKKVHWHVNAVTCLSYQDSEGIEPLLYSGGAESVLVTWQMTRDRPSDMLPRVAKGGISHLLSAGRASIPGVLVYCEDNTLQLFKSHSNQLVWKIQGLAGSINTKTTTTDNDVILVSSSSHSAGNLHWYDPRQQRATKILEVAPFNRTSRSSRSTNEKTHLPPPELTHIALSEDRKQMLTAETISTENSTVGKRVHHNKKEIGLVSTIKFWLSSSLVATMTFPHGEKNAISAIALSNNGHLACTVSNDEKAVRVWCQTNKKPTHNRHPAWSCRYKITTPSGFSKFTTPSNGVSFSSDGTTLCIVYGHMITLWDHKDATLLKTMQHFNERIERMELISNDRMRDFILTKSKTKIKLQSPYGDKGGWSFSLPSGSNTSLTQVQVINNSEQIAISVYFQKGRKTKILCVDSVTGKPTMVSEIPTKIIHILPVSKHSRRRKLGYGTTEYGGAHPPRFFVITKEDELLMIQNDDDDFLLESTKRAESTSSIKNQVPKIHIEKKRESPDSYSDEYEPSTKRVATLSLMGEDDGQVSSELPSLSGNLLCAFISRNISRQDSDEEDEEKRISA